MFEYHFALTGIQKEIWLERPNLLSKFSWGKWSTNTRAFRYNQCHIHAPPPPWHLLTIQKRRCFPTYLILHTRKCRWRRQYFLKYVPLLVAGKSPLLHSITLNTILYIGSSSRMYCIAKQVFIAGKQIDYPSFLLLRWFS